MQNSGIVYFKATKNNIIVMLDPEADFDEIKATLEFKATDSRKFFGNATAYIIFKGRALTEVQEKELVRIIETQTELKVYVVENAEKTGDNATVTVNTMPEYGALSNRQAMGYAQRETGTLRKNDYAGYDNILPLDYDYDQFEKMPAAYAEAIFSTENTEKSIFHKGSLRGGMCIECEGSVVILGDVNPGGEIIAGGNIIVLGILKGLAHAGAYGDKDAYVAALSLQPVQLRIANIITTVAEEISKNKKQQQSPSIPSYAYIQNDRIYIAPLV